MHFSNPLAVFTTLVAKSSHLVHNFDGEGVRIRVLAQVHASIRPTPQQLQQRVRVHCGAALCIHAVPHGVRNRSEVRIAVYELDAGTRGRAVRARVRPRVASACVLSFATGGLGF